VVVISLPHNGDGKRSGRAQVGASFSLFQLGLGFGEIWIKSNPLSLFASTSNLDLHQEPGSDTIVSYSRSTRCRSVGVSIPFRIKQHKVHRCREGEGEREWNGEVLPITSLRGGGVHHGVGVGGEKPVQWRRRWGIPPLAVRPLRSD
jgi:hypothetical protein